MLTRRTLLKRGGYAAFATALPTLIQTARAQTASFDFYIGTNGSDSNPGTQANPWSITAINSKRSTYAGKRVGILNGTYNVYALCQGGGPINNSGNAWNAPALGANGGTSGSPTVIAAVNPRQAIISALNPSGGGYPTVECPIIGQGASDPVANKGYLTLDGLVITGSYQSGAWFYFTALDGNGLGATPGLVVQNCEIYNISGNDNDNVSGIYFQGCSAALTHNNKIHDIQPATAGQNAQDVAGIYTYFCNGNVHEFNTIYNCNQGIRDKDTPAGSSTFRYNYVEVNGSAPVAGIGDGMGGIAGSTYTVHHNIINVIGSGATGWYFNGWGIGHKCPNFVYYNNTMIIPAGGNGPQLTALGSSPGSVTCYNNVTLVSGSGAPQGGTGLVSVFPGSVALMDYNLWSTGAASHAALCQGTPGGATGYTLANWQALGGRDAHSFALNPSFVSPTSLNPAGFKLQAGTAGSATGTSPGSTNGLSSGAACDMGAWGGAAPPTQIGCNFGPVPEPPVIISVT